MKHLLLVEDDALLRNTLSFNLGAEGYALCAASCVQEARAALADKYFDLVLLDVLLPDGDGYTLCQEIKALSAKTPVIFLTANDQEIDALRGYEVGALDYITKPFSLLALQKKIQAMLAILSQNGPPRDCFDDGLLYIDFDEQIARLAGEVLQLSNMELRVLKLFTQHPKQLLTRGQLLERLWDSDQRFVDEHTLTSTISRIRGKIETKGRRYLKTVYGMGYLWTGGETL